MATKAQRKAVSAYQKRQDNIMIRPSKDEGARIRQAAADAGISVQAFILDTLRARIGTGDTETTGQTESCERSRLFPFVRRVARCATI